jgi:cytochrome c oxidase subunit II
LSPRHVQSPQHRQHETYAPETDSYRCLRRRCNADVQPQVVEIHAKKFAYDPAEITLHKGQSYKLHVTSDDVPHSLRIKALNVNVAAKPGQFNDVLFTPDQVGDFKADCGVFCGSGQMKMAMTVHVVE